MEVLDKLKNCSDVKEAEEIIEKTFPGWLFMSLDCYSKDYPHLQKNWEVLCSKMNTTPKKIILVKEINFEEKDNAIINVCEFLTKNGYVVRRMEEFIACPVCERAMPCKPIWHLLKEKKFPVPDEWNNKCSSC